VIASQPPGGFTMMDDLQSTAIILTGYVQRRSIETELSDLQSNLEERVKERTWPFGFTEVTEMVREMSPYRKLCRHSWTRSVLSPAGNRSPAGFRVGSRQPNKWI
jgi:hypothetical protein